MVTVSADELRNVLMLLKRLEKSYIHNQRRKEADEVRQSIDNMATALARSQKVY